MPYTYNPFTSDLDYYWTPTAANPLSPTLGGTGVSNPTAHAVAVAEGSSNFNFIGPSSSTGAFLISNGSSSDPRFSDGSASAPSAFLSTDHLEVDTSLAGSGYIAVYNTAASASANALFIASTTNAIHGDAKIQFDDGGTYVWSDGLLHGTSGNYVISPSSTLGTNISFTITQAGLVTLPRQALTGLSGSTAVPVLGSVNGFTAQQYFVSVALTDASPVTWNANTQQYATLLMTSGIGATRQLQNPTNLVAGGIYVLQVTQSSTGTNALTYGANYKFPGGVAPTLSVANNAVDVLTFISNGTNMYLTGVQFGYA